MPEQEYEYRKQEICQNVAWQIFEEVNEQNDTLRHIDVNCLEADDAIAIMKAKIYDLACEAQKYQPGSDFVLNVLYAD